MDISEHPSWWPSFIISGGQTGADRGALIAGKLLGIKTGGYMPKGLRCDDGIGEKVAMEFGMKEAEGGYARRDRENVKISDAIIGFLLDIPNTGRGTTKTLQYALNGRQKYIPFQKEKPVMQLFQNRKPVLILWDISEATLHTGATAIADFVKKWKPHSLMVAGPCASTKSDIEDLVCRVLVQALTEGGKMEM